MAYQKAMIQVEGEKGTVEDKIYVMFNPAEYRLSDAATWTKQEDIGGPSTRGNKEGGQEKPAQYIRNSPTKLSLSLVFDTYDTSPESAGANIAERVKRFSGKPSDVTKLTRKIVALTEVKAELHRPPICRFVWGSLYFRGFIQSVESHYTMFTDDGTPVRARLDVSFESYSEKADQRENPRESPDRTKYRVLSEGDQLWHIANNEYGDPGLWRVIAEANGIENIRKIPSGTMLRIPALTR